MIRNIVAAIVGVIVAVSLVWLIETLGHMVYPLPDDVDFSDSEQVRTFTATLPAAAVLFVGAAWAFGAFCGTVIAALIATAKPVIYAIIVGGIVLAGSISMLIIIPHPGWFTITAPIAVLVAAYLGMYVAPRLRRPRTDSE